MTRLSDPLEALVRAEQPAVAPSPEVAAACWDSIAADLERGALPALDVPPPAPPRHPMTWVALTLVGVATLAAGLHAWRGEGELATEQLPVAQRVSDETPAVAVADAPVSKTMSRQPSLVHASEAPAPVIAPASTPPDAPSPAPEEPALAVQPVPAATPTATKPRRPAAPEAVPEDTFAAELKLLAQGHAALNRGDHREALRISDLYKNTYPNGHFKEDREALRALAQCAAGDGRTAARRFVANNPRSIHVTRLREACALPADAEQ